MYALKKTQGYRFLLEILWLYSLILLVQLMVLFIYGVFNNAVGSFDYVLLNDNEGIMPERCIKCICIVALHRHINRYIWAYEHK